MKKYLSTGFATLIPIALTIWILSYLFNLFTEPLYQLVEKWILKFAPAAELGLEKHQLMMSYISRCIALILTFFFVLLLGFLARKFFFHSLLQLTHRLMLRIPFVRTIYRLTKDLTKAVLSANQKTFKETVLTPFPSSHTYACGFVTGHVPEDFKKNLADKGIDTVVFVPTSPHPISGYLLFCKKSNLPSLPLSTEETFKYIISCGVTYPHKPSIPDTPL